MYVKSARWLIYAVLALMISIFGFLGLALTQITGATGNIQPMLLLPSLIISTLMFLFCCSKAIGLRN